MDDNISTYIFQALSIFLSLYISQSVNLSLSISICLCIYLSIYLSINLSISSSPCLSQPLYISLCLSISVSPNSPLLILERLRCKANSTDSVSHTIKRRKHTQKENEILLTPSCVCTCVCVFLKVSNGNKSTILHLSTHTDLFLQLCFPVYF